jgi:hypothetical protein
MFVREMVVTGWTGGSGSEAGRFEKRMRMFGK